MVCNDDRSCVVQWSVQRIKRVDGSDEYLVQGELGGVQPPCVCERNEVVLMMLLLPLFMKSTAAIKCALAQLTGWENGTDVAHMETSHG